MPSIPEGSIFLDKYRKSAPLDRENVQYRGRGVHKTNVALRLCFNVANDLLPKPSGRQTSVLRSHDQIHERIYKCRCLVIDLQ